ncbi:MAG: ATP-binding protein [Bdellovibrionota bacterium]
MNSSVLRFRNKQQGDGTSDEHRSEEFNHLITSAFNSALLQSIPGTISCIDIDSWTYIYVNELLEKKVGRSKEELLGQKVGALTKKSDSEKSTFELIIESFLASDRDKLLIEKSVLFGPNEEPIPYLLSLKKWLDNRVLLVVGIDISQVSDLRRALDKEKQLSEENYQKALFSEQLASLGAFSSSIVHEIRNHITILAGTEVYMEIVKMNLQSLEKSIEEANKQQVKGVSQSVQQLDKAMAIVKKHCDKIHLIIKSVQDLTSTKGNNEEKEEHNLKALAHEAVNFLTTLTKSRDVKITVSETSQTIRHMIKYVHTYQVLTNLISNAVDAIECLQENSKWITVDVGISDDGYPYIAVTDGGSGIPEEIRDKVMLPFFSTKTNGKGTGLGLSLSKSRMEDQGGDLIIDDASPNTKFVMLFNV